MKRSVLNSVYFAILFSSIINCTGYLIFKEISFWNGLVVVVLFIAVKSQHYLFEKKDKTYYRRIPFFHGIPIEKLKSAEDLRLLDTSSNIVSLWQLIKLKSIGQES